MTTYDAAAGAAIEFARLYIKKVPAPPVLHTNFARHRWVVKQFMDCVQIRAPPPVLTAIEISRYKIAH